jgi:DNA anti-recombination protein RmuC
MMRRMITAHRKRVATGNAEDLADLVKLRAELDDAITEGARALHDGTAEQPGLSWTEIAAVLGVSRQAARQRFGAGA